VLYQEAELLVREELREPRLYFSILRAISEGSTRASDIQSRVRPNSARSDLTPYLHTLQELGLVSYLRPVVGGGERRGIWNIADPYLRFWFRFVIPHQTQLDIGGSHERIYRQAVAPQLDHFVSRPSFEEVCRAWVLERANAGAFGPVDRVGAWWGPVPAPTPENPRRQAEAELEIIAASGQRVRLAGEAKWSREPVTPAVLNHLRDLARHLPGADPTTRLALFGRRFATTTITIAREEGVLLVTPDDLYKASDAPAPTRYNGSEHPEGAPP
jgi:hypothetical protein